MCLDFRRRVLLAAVAISWFCLNTAVAQLPISVPAIQPRELAATARIEAALARNFALEFVKTPLRDVAAYIADQAGVTIVLSRKIEDAGVQADQPVTVNRRDISLESALNLMLHNLNLTIMVKDETLTITTVEDAQSPENMVARVYPVLDLLERSERGYYDFDPLIDLITSTIEPDSWQDVGGPGSINGFDNAGSLVFSQRRDIHQRIESLLFTLRQVKRQQGVSTPFTPTRSDDVQLSRSLKYTRRSSTPIRVLPPAAQMRFEGGLFSVPNVVSKNVAENHSTTVRQPRAATWQLPQVYESRE